MVITGMAADGLTAKDMIAYDLSAGLPGDINSQ